MITLLNISEMILQDQVSIAVYKLGEMKVVERLMAAVKRDGRALLGNPCRR